MGRVHHRLARLLVAMLMLAACGGTTAEDDRPLVVVTTTILGDIVRQVAGDEARLEVLFPIGADPHDHLPSARQVALLNEADLVVANGLGLEEGLLDILETSRDGGIRILEVAPLVDPLPFGEHDAHDDDGHDHGAYDPHVWMDPMRMAAATLLIADELEAVAPDGGWRERGEDYAAHLAEVDGAIAALMAAIPTERRKLVTNHDSLGYFAERYGFTVVGVVIPGGSTLGEPSSAAIAALVSTMRSEGVSTVFSENIDTDSLAHAIAAELGSDAGVVPLFTDSIGGPGSGAETLADLLMANARRISEALG